MKVGDLVRRVNSELGVGLLIKKTTLDYEMGFSKRKAIQCDVLFSDNKIREIRQVFLEVVK